MYLNYESIHLDKKSSDNLLLEKRVKARSDMTLQNRGVNNNNNNNNNMMMKV